MLGAGVKCPHEGCKLRMYACSQHAFLACPLSLSVTLPCPMPPLTTPPYCKLRMYVHS